MHFMQVKFGSWNFGAVGSGFARPKVQDPSVCSSKTQLYAGKFWVLGVWRGWEQLILVDILLRTKTQDLKSLAR
jgi:hypothetical protein